MNYIKLISLLVIAYCPIIFAQIEDDIDELTGLYDDEELIRIGTGTAKPIRFSPSVASVITVEDIQRSGARTLAEVLDTVPGIHVSDSLLFDDDLISIRGVHTSNNPQVLVLIDGVEVRHLFTAARPAGFRMPLENVHRIEIIRGPGSAVYGADAFSGVINVITKSAQQINGTQFGARFGSFDSQDVWMQAGYSTDEIEFAFSHEYTRSDGDSDRLIESDGLGRTGQFRSEYEIYNTQLKASLGNWDLRLHNWRLNNGGNGPGGAQVLDESGSVEADYYQFDLGYQSIISDGWLLDARAGYNQSQTDIDNVLFPEGTTIPIAADGNAGMGADPLRTFNDGVIGNPSADAVIIDADIAVTYDLLTNHLFRLAAGYKHEDFDTSETKNFGPGVLDITSNPAQVVPANVVDVSNTDFIFIEDVKRNVYYFSLQDEWKLADDWELTAGVRYDEYSDVGSTVNPRLALVWAAEYNLTAKFLYGRAFRAPSFTELYSQNNPALLGNPNLEPETIDTYEAALDYQINRDMNLLVNVFYYEIKDLIDLVFDPTAGLRAQNAIDQKGQGVELSFSWQVSDFVDFETNLSLQDIEDKNTGDSVAGVPDSQLYAAVTWNPIDDLRLAAEVNWVGGRERAPNDVRGNVKDYSLVNLTMRKSMPDLNLDMGIWVNNLFDEKAKEPSQMGPVFVATDYPIEGRSIFLDIRYHLN